MVCTKCGEDKDETEFYKNFSQCKECHRLNMKKQYNKNKTHYKAKGRRAMIKKDYGITQEEYNYCMSTSDCCQICGSTENLCYDHDHTTMKFRGVLCKKCNKGLGLLGDNKEGILRALEYIS